MRQVSRPHISLTAGISSAVCPPRPSPLPAKPENAPLRVDFLEEETGTHYLKISGSMLGLLNTFWRSTCSCKMLQNVTDLYNIYIYIYIQIITNLWSFWKVLFESGNQTIQHRIETWHGTEESLCLPILPACSPHTRNMQQMHTNHYKSIIGTTS